MNLETLIHQKVFKNDYQKLMLHIIVANNILIEQQKNIFAKFNLSLQKFNILRILRGAKTALSTSQIKERMLDKNSDTSRIVDRMILKNLVIKEQSKGDKRLVSITISDLGLAILEKLDKEEEAFFKSLTKLSETEAATMCNLFEKIQVV